MPARRRLDFQWNLRQLMAAHQMWKTTQLVPLLAERGVKLSAAQVYRLVTDKPERLSMKTLVALCDIFGCSPNDLITPHVVAARTPKAAAGEGGAGSVMAMPGEFRPERARILDDEDTGDGANGGGG
ncbi:helix-turn-helix domain-containing protein [Pseudonocardia sp. RS010]|uniref:helix-turn-helix domain-containing protein n=1 Tax=Pseudonocardia sp. RS010 TaxID=3385979 RepID=UPI0039A14470